MSKLFLEYFPNHTYRYLDQTGNGRKAIPSAVRNDELNLLGYCSYFTVNGFIGSDATIASCSNLNAFFIDIDGRKDPNELEAIKKRIQPTFIIETGRGYHLYWILAEPIFRDECFGTEWEDSIKKWEAIENQIVKDLHGDTNVKDVPRILRVPGTYYWKRTANEYKKGTKGVFKIKGIEKMEGARYSMKEMEEAFPIKEEKIEYPLYSLTPVSEDKQNSALKKYADSEKKDFFNRLNKVYPIEERPSFKALISGAEGTIPPNGSRHGALLVTISMMRDAGWKQSKAVDHFKVIGWHGVENEKGREKEFVNAVKDVYSTGYTYSFKNEIIAHNTTPEEQQNIQEAYTKVAKVKKDSDKIRYTNYERELLVSYPHLKKNEIGLIFNYDNGVYRMMTDIEITDLFLNGLYDDMLWGYRTRNHVSDKIACLLSIIPYLELTDDGGNILNLKNGLLNLQTLELQPHTPNFVSLVQFPVNYDPNAHCPTWLKCMDSWTIGEEAQEKAHLLQQFAGYCLSSSMQYDKALFLVGDGGAGKSTFIDTIGMVFGEESVSHIDLEGLYGQYGMKGLIGKRLNIIEEVEGNFYHSNKLKKLISGEPVTIDIKYKDQFTFRPQAKFVFAVNMIPRIDDSSTATERRMLVVHFKNNFQETGSSALRGGRGELAKELSGILNWMIVGALSLREKNKFLITDEHIKLLQEYRMENSSVEGFIGECLIFGEGYSETTRELYDEYKNYCTRDGRKFKGSIAFSKEMKTYGIRYKKFVFEARGNGKNSSKFIGVKIDDSWSQERVAQASFNSF